MNIDNREVYKHEYWQQGRLLLTRRTRKWSDAERNRVDYGERCMAFVNFSSVDEGRSRILVYKYGSPGECAEAVYEHNKVVMKFIA